MLERFAQIDRASRDVEQSRFDFVEPREGVHRAIEIAIFFEITAGEKDIAQGAVREVETAALSGLFGGDLGSSFPLK